MKHPIANYYFKQNEEREETRLEKELSKAQNAIDFHPDTSCTPSAASAVFIGAESETS